MIHIIAVGKLKELHYRQAAREYEKRLARFTSLKVTELADEREPDKPSLLLEERARHAEGERIMKHIRSGDRVVALCIDGTQEDSLAFSRRIKRLYEAPAQVVFIIGGSLGLSEAVIARADEKLSLSALTFPHQLARVLLLEQLYRAFKIMANERYHK
ncbi:MAG: 23S rRNA (pseudouridine(1915)-N(3))-methyltransferase RlmH [Eubacteriales bacterium]|nr:23S rRNA (pseudouridine(1915)-N(3))-methyltransferase RlmH [Eubacteriales bacterium]MDD3571992.1 23S rRNA (pseudouridine(1915)-N(3))-methyltransferase RlmH [Eubacteriales bacterium]NLO13867.1 23S rRNA (pseudouridine(1915)-N(3))-methyltransferase RlmH [Clostridiales bacterium]